MSTTTSSQQMTESVPSAEDTMNLDSTILGTNNGDERTLASTGSNVIQQQHQTILSSLPENRFELELEFIQALSSPAYIHFLATSRTLDDSLLLSSSSSSLVTHPQTQSTLQQLQPFLHYLYETYSQPEYARFLRYPHALFFLESLLVYDEDHHSKKESFDATSTNSAPKAPSSNTKGSSDTTSSTGIPNKLWVEWTVPSFRNFCHQQQFLAWQHRHSTCYGVGSIATMNTTASTTNNNNQEDTNLQQEIAAAGLVDENDDMDDDDDNQE